MPGAERGSIYIAGRWLPAGEREILDVVNPATEEVIGGVCAGTARDAGAAVAAARGAVADWSQTPRAERADRLDAIADHLAARAGELAALVTSELGMPVAHAERSQVLPVLEAFRAAAELARTAPLEERVGRALVVREPVGVVACITPWNFPLGQAATKAAYALAAGCTVVLKPSTVAPLAALALAEAADAAGLPPGTFNLVTGRGPIVGRALAAHPDVDMVSFTGSTEVGRTVAGLAAETVKRLVLELGGKSACVVLEDADLERAATRCVQSCCFNSGQVCSALTRLLVPRDRLAEAERIAAEAAADLVVGDPRDPRSDLGPLVSEEQRSRVRAYLRRGREEGARILVGGEEPPPGLARGYYVRPTVLSDVRPEATVAQEEIFGPVLVIIGYEDEDDAVAIANGTIYGLAGAVWSGDPRRARRVAARLRCGEVEVNGARHDRRAPFGGYKQSGLGRERGRFGFEAYLELKSVFT